MNQIGANLDDYGFEVFEENEYPLAYLLTFRTYGTWLHGDKRYSVQRNLTSAYGTPMTPPNLRLENWMLEEMKAKPFLLNESMRKVVFDAIEDLCTRKDYAMRAANVRTNHVHAVL